MRNYNKLPDIYIKELSGRFLIDTGASQSLISPRAFSQKINNCIIKNETNHIKSMRQLSTKK